MGRDINISVLDSTYAQIEDIVNEHSRLYNEKLKYGVSDFSKQAVICELEKYSNFMDIAKEECVMPTITHPNAKIKLKLREYFFHKRISQTDVCEELGLQNGTLSGIVNGKHKPNFEIFLKLYFHLGCPPLHEIISIEE